MGVWMRWVVLGLMRWAGLLATTALTLKLLYRNATLVQKPLWVAFAFHLVLFVLMVWLFWRIGSIILVLG